jgi:3-methyladenine DNA glycosylase AlkD
MPRSNHNTHTAMFTHVTQVRHALVDMADVNEKAIIQRYFKTSAGAYAEHDIFVGIKTPRLRALAARCHALALNAIENLLCDPVHEYRMLALILMQHHYQRGAQNAVFASYVAHRQYINNWDLVDTSAAPIVGDYLLTQPRTCLYQWAHAPNLWERRIAIVATLAFIRQGQFDDTLQLAQILVHDTHDLIHKACGWMLREVGKRDHARLCDFLDTHAPTMPRTMLRYSIEKFEPALRREYLQR